MSGFMRAWFDAAVGSWKNVACDVDGKLLVVAETGPGAGQALSSASTSVVPASDSAAFPVARKSFFASVPFTRPNNVTPYRGNDIVGPTGASALLTFPTGGAAGELYQIQSFDVLIPSAGELPAGMTTFALFLFDSVPTVLADNAPIALALADYPKFQGRIITGSAANYENAVIAGGSGVNARQVKLASGNLYGYLVTAGGYTSQAISEVCNVVLGGSQL